MNNRDILIIKSNDSLMVCLEKLYENISEDELNELIEYIKVDGMEDYKTDGEERDNILNYIEDLDLDLEDVELLDTYTDEEIAELKSTRYSS